MTVFKQNHKGEKHFTLLELLIVVAIIAILTAMLLPVLNKAREAGLASNCRGNLRQQTVALLQYAGDNNDFYPVIWNADGTANFTIAPVLTTPYLGTKGKVINNYFNPYIPTLDSTKHVTPGTPYNGSKVFYCPSRRNTAAAAQYSDYGGYIFNWVPKFYEFKISHLKQPTKSLFRVDSYSPGTTIGCLNIGSHNVHFRHNGRANTVFFDGHGSSVSTGITDSFVDFAQLK